MKLKNEIGNKYCRLTVVCYSHSDAQGMAYWCCLCECGNNSIVSGAHLRDGHTKSCGCLQKDLAGGWNKGMKQSPETIEKRVSKLRGRARPPFSRSWKDRIGQSSKGRTASLETRIKMSESRKGEKCHLWKGGITPVNKKIRQSMESVWWRNSVFQRDEWTCQKCHKKGGNMEAHHKKPFAYFPELRFEVSNGETLCVDCHKKTKHGNQTFFCQEK